MSTRGRRNLEPVGQLKLFFTFFLTKFEGEVLTILLPGVNQSFSSMPETGPNWCEQ